MSYADRLRNCVTASRGVDCRDPDLLLNSAAALETALSALIAVRDDMYHHTRTSRPRTALIRKEALDAVMAAIALATEPRITAPAPTGPPDDYTDKLKVAIGELFGSEPTP